MRDLAEVYNKTKISTIILSLELHYVRFLRGKVANGECLTVGYMKTVETAL